MAPRWEFPDRTLASEFRVIQHGSSRGVASCCHGYPMGHKAQFQGLVELPACFLGVRPVLGSLSPTLTRGWTLPAPAG